jgi:hypothetical protein
MNPIKLRHGFQYDPPTQNGPAMNVAVFHLRVCVTAILAAAFFSLTVVVSVAADMALGSPSDKRQSKSNQLKQVSLSDKDRELLEGLLRSVVFDPKGAKRVRVEWIRRGAWGKSEKVNREGWLVKGRGKTQARVYFADGLFIFAPDGTGKIGELDFLGECAKRFEPIKKKKHTVNKGSPVLFIDPDAWKLAANSMRREACGEIGEPELVVAV